MLAVQQTGMLRIAEIAVGSAGEIVFEQVEMNACQRNDGAVDELRADLDTDRSFRGIIVLETREKTETRTCERRK